MDVMIYVFYLLSFGGVIYFSQRSEDAFVRPACLFILLYQVPLVAFSYNMYYFGTNLAVSYNAMHYLAAVLLNALMILAIVIRVPTPSAKSFGSTRGFFAFLLVAAVVAAAVDAGFNLDYLLLEKADRFSGDTSKIMNLIIIEFDWILIFTAAGIVLFQAGRKVSGAVVVGVMSVLGLALGMRYYFVIPFLVLFGHITRNMRVSRRVLAAAVFLAAAPVLGSFLDSLKGYIIFYQWVSENGFFAYWMDSSEFSVISGEIGAIGANYWIGINHHIGNPDFFSYAAALIPGSNRFFDMADQTAFYNGISDYLTDIDVSGGQGAAFGMLLESYYTFGLPILFFSLIKWVHQLPWADNMRPVVLCVCLYLAINIARNGMVVGISILKVYVLLYLLYLLVRTVYSFCKKTAGTPLHDGQPT